MILWNIAVLAAVGIILASAIAAFVTVRRGHSQPSSSKAPSLIGLTLFLSTSWAGLNLLAVAVTLVIPFSANAWSDITVPIQSYWPTATAGTADSSDIYRTFTHAQIGGVGLPFGTKLLGALGAALGSLAHAAVAALVAIVCFQILRGRAFVGAVTRATLIAAMVVLVGGVASELLTGAASAQAATAALGSYVGNESRPQPTGSWELDRWPPVSFALALLALATILREGAHLQRDTEGLV